MTTRPYWLENSTAPGYPALAEDLEVDVLVIGGGITGLSTLHLLQEAGLSAALVERDRIGSGDSSHTTAHLTYMTDTRLSELIEVCGKDRAQIAWQAGKAAMDHISVVCQNAGTDVHLSHIPGFLAVAENAPDPSDEEKRLQEEARVATEMGFDARYEKSIAPTDAPGIRFADQMKFHPLRYLHVLAAQSTKLGARIFENTNVSEFGDDPSHVTANGHEIRFKKVVIATHVPLQGNAGTVAAALFQTKLASYSTYAIAAKCPRGQITEMIWSNTADPFDYLRVDPQEDHDLLIFGGEDHKTGQVVETDRCFQNLEKKLSQLVAGIEVTHRWSGQVVETVDGLPFIGEIADGQFIATGFSGNGYTLGVAASLLIRDLITGAPNPWTSTFDPHRKLLRAAGTYAAENKDFPLLMIKDRLGIPLGDPQQLSAGHGCVMKSDGEKIAACRLADGTIHRLSAVCPHMGCIVAWNEGEETWDCPCHGSRFAADGSLLAGPAETGLSPI